ncbi:bleomycin resistance protein [Rathayibacter iranicus]|uniref:Bleomycin resistance protein n=2 Tax=Rathayibacter iranicus TaxID=59737 RepID=A0AAD1AG10_9MICO|nr:VOC family protein [Rathayibacter iranicus]AZZ55869.1 VOC family protein [Rathayibacter iranicus]MWV30691.1 VOC family protein [Rathayibacter iranicus NCPPB 2253 = VKM Ac-1602]PPI47374.1 bleomycin resistance family protein [Rathayibacter iranicus]PPI60237.1 bleomycin resistance family protein [Rathayibacter iranicus]PPI71785.1 bleomycin resistance family protein [Rathayibacter iranicus]
MTDPDLVPELLVENLERSLAFWCGPCGFRIRYSRPEEGFAYLVLGTAHVMLEQAGLGRHWLAGALDQPLGRGMNLQIHVEDADRSALALAEAGVVPFSPLETRWYRIGAEEAGVRQLVVADPDGYLLRFQSSLGRRSA